MLILGLALIALSLFLAYRSGADTHDRAQWTRKAAERQQVASQYADAMAAGQSRHPSRRSA